MPGIEGNTWALLLVAGTNFLTAVLVLLAKRDIRKIEIATNSMKDALIVSTAKASLAEGKEAGRIAELERDKGVSKG